MSRLLPGDLAAALPPLYGCEHEPDPLVRVKFFTPDSNWTWFAIEYSPEERLFFGLVIGHESELGYFSLDELESARGPLGLPIERDLNWVPKPLSQCER
jgi:hypothetical protein